MDRHLSIRYLRLFHISLLQHLIHIPQRHKLFIYLIPCNVHILLLIIPEHISLLKCTVPSPAPLTIIGHIHIRILPVHMADPHVSPIRNTFRIHIAVHHEVHTVIQIAHLKEPVCIHLPAQLLLDILKQRAVAALAPSSPNIFGSFKSSQIQCLRRLCIRLHYQVGCPQTVNIAPIHRTAPHRPGGVAGETAHCPVNPALRLINDIIYPVSLHRHCQKHRPKKYRQH